MKPTRDNRNPLPMPDPNAKKRGMQRLAKGKKDKKKSEVEAHAREIKEVKAPVAGEIGMPPGENGNAGHQREKTDGLELGKACHRQLAVLRRGG